MRIAFFCPHSDPLARAGEPDAGGQCVYEAQVAAGLAANGHEVRCYTRRYGDKPPHDAITDGATVRRFPMGPEGFLRKEDMGPFLAEFAQQVISDERDWLEGASVFHGHYWDGGATALEASLAFGKGLVFTSHSLGALKRERVPEPSPDGSTFRYHIRIPAERRVLHAADRVIALSNVERQALTDCYWLSADKVEIVPGGVDVEAYAPPKPKQALKASLRVETDFVVFTTGRLDPRKGFVELIAAIPHTIKAVEQAGKSVTFFLPAGPESPSVEETTYKTLMQTEAENGGVMDHIRWFSRLSDEDLKLYYAAADVFACPSPYEPFGLVLVEAFASGTPVVATMHGGPREIVTSGEDGYLAEPRNANEFGARIADILLKDEEQRAAMSKAAIEKAHARYAWSAVAKHIAQVYQELQ